MGVFGAFFGCIGVVGFNGRCSGASIGDGGFTLVCISGRCGDGGFTVDTWLCPVREKVRPAGCGGGCEREKVRPAHEKWPKNGVFWRAGRSFSRKHGWRGRAGRFFSRTGSRVILLGELCRAVALVVGPLLAVLTLRCAATPYGWHGGQPARATTHRVNLRMKGPRPPAVGSSVAAGCARLHAARRVYVRRLGVARKRSGVMCGWLCSRVRIGAPRPNPGGALPQPTIRRSAVPPEWRT